MTKTGLGRGLSSLIPNKLNPEPSDDSRGGQIIDETVVDERVRQIAIDKIEANPMQPREYFDHGQLEELVNSIKKHGILQPLIVTPTVGDNFQLVAGERRLKAAQILELRTVPCLIRDVKELEQLELSLIENLQRADLNPIEEAKAYKKLIDEFNLIQEEVGERVGKKRATVANALRLLDLPEEIQEALKQGKISTGHAKVILSEETDAGRLKLFKKILKFNLTVRGAEGEVKKIKVRSHDRIITKDVEIQEKEDRLRKALGTKVSINKKGDGGTITVDFYSAEELNELVDRISR